jgi:hypothetical protein
MISRFSPGHSGAHHSDPDDSLYRVQRRIHVLPPALSWRRAGVLAVSVSVDQTSVIGLAPTMAQRRGQGRVIGSLGGHFHLHVLAFPWAGGGGAGIGRVGRAGVVGAQAVSMAVFDPRPR